MHLIDIRSLPALNLQEFVGNEIPKNYAILSHRWGHTKEEISFQEMLHQKAVTTDLEKKRWWKVESFCQQACDDGFEFAWVDTCCINKDSSAELSEAINSMFEWYRQATKCYVYLADVSNVEQLAKSEWFQRGWTLQELLAPRNIQFFSHDWNKLGDKRSLLGTLAAITKFLRMSLMVK